MPVAMMGYSDDVLYLEYGDYNDEVSCFDSEVHVEVVPATSAGGGLRAIWRYGMRDALWSVEVERLREDAPIPWPVAITEGRRPYSVALRIDVDAGDVTVSCKVVRQ